MHKQLAALKEWKRRAEQAERELALERTKYELRVELTRRALATYLRLVWRVALGSAKRAPIAAGLTVLTEYINS